jgi:hypothetical protein
MRNKQEFSKRAIYKLCIFRKLLSLVKIPTSVTITTLWCKNKKFYGKKNVNHVSNKRYRITVGR